MNRRQFLCSSGALGLVAASAAVLPAAGGWAATLGRGRQVVSRTRAMMGTFVTVVAVHDSGELAGRAVEAAFEAVTGLSRILDRRSKQTPMAALNARAELVHTPQPLAEVLECATGYWRLSRGAFNPAVTPVLELYKHKAATGADLALTEDELDTLLPMTDFSRVRWEGERVWLDRPAMELTLDGVAKGYIVDRAAEAMAALGVADGLVNAGGDIRTMGRDADESPWRVAIQNPDRRGRYPDVLSMGDGAVATSGSYEIFFDDEKVFHHLVDPATGRCPLAAAGVSATAPTVMEADALSTAVFVLGPRRGVQLVESLPGRECLLVLRDGTVRSSSGWGRA